MRTGLIALLVLGAGACEHGFDGPTPAITTVAPAVVCNALDTTVTLTGAGFTPVPEQVLSNQSVLVLPTVTLVDASGTAFDVADEDVHWTNEVTMTFVARASLALAPGVYDVVVTNPTGKQGRAENAITIVPPPTLSSVVPDAVCHDLATSITLTGTNFRSDPQAGPLTVIIGTPTPTVLSEADGAVTFVNDTTARATVPTGLPDGLWDVTIRNADGCEATLPMALRVVPPPAITMLDPSTVWNGADATLTIRGMNFRMTPTVAIAAAGGAAIPLGTVTFVDAQTVTAVVPMGTPPGSYTLTLTNPDGCSATAPLTVTNMQPITVTGVINPFGCASQNTPITITGTFFQSTPQAVLVGAGAGGVDLKLRNVAFVSATKLTALVPAGGVIGGPYALTVTNPDGGVATLAAAFTITKLCPPVIDDVDPNSVVHNYNTAVSGPVILTGSNFRADATVVLVDTAGVERAFPGASVTVTPTEITLQFNAAASNLGDGIYLVRVKEADDTVANGGTGAVMFGDFSLFIVTNPSGKFHPAQMAQALPSGRRGLGVVGGQVNAAARFIYAIAGDGGGVNAATLADGLFAALDVFGRIGDLGWQLLRKRDPSSAMPPADTANALPSARTGVAVAQHNRWIYVVGGTTGLASGAAPAPSPGGPLTEVVRARILSAADAPVVVSSTAPGGTLPAGTYYYKVAFLIAAGTAGYGAAAAETVASDEEVVTVAAGQSARLDVALPTSLSFPSAQITGYRVYRSPAANGVSQSEISIADTSNAFFVDDGSATPSGAHPLAAGMLSAWEPAGASLSTTRAYPSVTLAVPPPSPSPSPSPLPPNLYVVGGFATAALASSEFAVINSDGTLGSFASTGGAMTAPRRAGYAGTVAGPPSVTSDTWIIAGAGATTGGAAVQERARVNADGTLASWAPIPTGPGGAFTTNPTTLGPIGFYSNGHIAIVDGWTGNNVQNRDEFGDEACSVALVAGVCPAGNDFRQVAKSSSTLSVTPPVAWCGYTITSGYVFIVGGSTDGTNAVTIVQQGAQ